jgi:hypothetical protein
MIWNNAKTVDGILSTFHTTIKKLEDHKSKKIAEAERLEAEMHEKKVAHIDAKTESERAGIIANKLSELIMASNS